jgi:hypothetical protein
LAGAVNVGFEGGVETAAKNDRMEWGCYGEIMSDEFRDKWPEMRMKHLELLQNAISRMGANNANLKGYCMTMVAAVLGLAAAVSKGQIIIYTLPIVLAFSVLDSVYLSLERGFINHFNSIRKTKLDKQPDFHMYTNYDEFLNCYISWSVLGFYGAISIIMCGIYFIFTFIVESN